ncbi:hypothetical protein SUGI_0770160 [Cryptomeria japonica]|nr:hypothetical protein SUGI_0770160 [Cryptomeria japonica]
MSHRSRLKYIWRWKHLFAKNDSEPTPHFHRLVVGTEIVLDPLSGYDSPQLHCQRLWQQSHLCPQQSPLLSILVDNQIMPQLNNFTTAATMPEKEIRHTFCGYWGGVCPRSTKLPSEILTPRLLPGLESTMEDLAVDKIVNNGVGLVPPKRAAEIYDALHSYLSWVGIIGVKVDVIHILELLSEGLGEHVELAKAYFNGLSESMMKYFKGNGVIASMEHCNDLCIWALSRSPSDVLDESEIAFKEGRLLALLRRGRINI